MKKNIIFLLILVLPLCGCNDAGTSKSANESGVSQNGEAEESGPSTDDRAYTLDKYLQIGMGSTYEDVVSALGASGEASVDGDVLKQYLWENEDGSNISVTFENNNATAKTQAYLGPYLRGKEKVTMKLFQKLKEGSSLAEAEEILGQGTETMRQVISGEESVTYMWNNSDGSSISILFKNGKAADINDIMLD